MLVLLLSFAVLWGNQYKDDPLDQNPTAESDSYIKEKIIPEKYPWPLKINNGFSSGFQEFRSNHFHGGCDLRTFQKTGYPVYAIADGNIYKIRMVKRGSGRGLYLKHDDGNTSIYFHLDRFERKLENLLKRVQKAYNKKYIGNYFLKKPLRYKKGDLIGYTGETGSGFPHLHLEIRDKYYYALNPFKLIKSPAQDKNYPVLKKILVRNRGHASINGDIGEHYFKFHRKALGHYYVAKPLILSGDVDIILNAYDISDTGRHMAPYTVSTFVDDICYFQLQFDRFERDDNNQLGFVYDMYYSNSSSYFFNLFTQNGFKLEQKKKSFQQVFEGLDHGKHVLRVQVVDNAGNISTGVVPFYKVSEPILKVSNIKKSETGDELFLEISKLQSEEPPIGEIKINVFNHSFHKISTGTLHHHFLSKPKPLVLKDFSNEAANLEFVFYANKVPYHRQKYFIHENSLNNITRIDYDVYLNRDEVFLLIKDRHLNRENLLLTVIQGEESKRIEPEYSRENIYFKFKPMNRENRVLLRFSVLEEGKGVAEIQESLNVIYLKEGEKQEYKYREFTAKFGVRAVYEPKVLRVEEREYGSEYPILSRQVSISPYSFPFLDTVYYKFRKKLSNPKQVGIFQYNPFSKKWSSRYTVYDKSTNTYRIRVISSGVYALMRDIFSPKVWFSRPKVKYRKSLRRLLVKISDKGKGVNDNTLKVWLNGSRICTAYNCACEYDPDRRSLVIEELGNLRVGKNILKVYIEDYAGNRTERTFHFNLR